MDKKEFKSVIREILFERIGKSLHPLVLYPNVNGNKNKYIRVFLDKNNKVKTEIFYDTSIGGFEGMLNPRKTLKEEELQWLSDNINNYK